MPKKIITPKIIKHNYVQQNHLGSAPTSVKNQNYYRSLASQQSGPEHLMTQDPIEDEL